MNAFVYEAEFGGFVEAECEMLLLAVCKEEMLEQISGLGFIIRTEKPRSGRGWG